jgi:hypothetical protein
LGVLTVKAAIAVGNGLFFDIATRRYFCSYNRCLSDELARFHMPVANAFGRVEKTLASASPRQ